LNFPALAHVVEEVGDRFGRYQDLECRALKNRLVDREKQLPGRVLLSDFYKKGLQGHFTESVEYLRELGALDESDPKMPPSVVVPNYINSKANCHGASSSFYSVCCIDECAGLMGHLEREIAMPTAKPPRIAALVASMPSDSMVARRNLSTTLLSRLDAIAERHAGLVPLHGRLFAQWMHHAYPNECQYPQVVAETSSQAASPQAPKSMHRKDMLRYADRFSVEDELLVDNYDLPWMDVEKLLDYHHEAPMQAAEYGFRGFVRNLALLGALVSMVVGLVSTWKSAVAPLDSALLEKYSVSALVSMVGSMVSTSKSAVASLNSAKCEQYSV